MQAQRAGWGSHPAVRMFWTPTELDDFDPNCTKRLASHFQFALGCRRHRRGDSWLRRFLRGNYARPQYLMKMGYGPGWICAQSRFGEQLGVVSRKYSSGQLSTPDWLLLTDDDTYINLPLFLQWARRSNSQIPVVHAGCLVRHPIHMINFTFPWGGFGSFFNRRSVKRLATSVHCSSSAQDDYRVEIGGGWRSFQTNVCKRVQQSLLGEAELFHSGMSVGDLGARLADPSHCLHGDWILGYLVNFYFLSAHVEDPHYSDVQHSRLWHTGGSASTPGLAEVYGSRNVGRRSHCDADMKSHPAGCQHGKSLLCHGVNASRTRVLANKG
jgi:hypothetical protein